jgi:hypothetical protein
MDLPQSYVAAKRGVNKGEERTIRLLMRLLPPDEIRAIDSPAYSVKRIYGQRHFELVKRRLSRRAGNEWVDACRSYDTVILFLNRRWP